MFLLHHAQRSQKHHKSTNDEFNRLAEVAVADSEEGSYVVAPEFTARRLRGAERAQLS